MDGTLVRAQSLFEIVRGDDGDLLKVTVDGLGPLYYPVELFERQIEDATTLLVNYRAKQRKR
jgi:hypothetical protein